jgi:hypothetical protein
MALIKKAFANGKWIAGQVGSFFSSLIPLSMAQETKLNMPIPIDMTTTTFVINASVTEHVPIVIGEDYSVLKETITYTWTASNNTILSSAGEVTTAQSFALGVWYFYIGISDAGAYLLYPSQTAPSMVEGAKPNGHLAHPGTTADRAWSYVGFQICDDATAPTVIDMTKTGYTYNTTDLTVATGTAWAELAFTGAKALPKHGALGLTVNGHLETGAGGTVTIGNTSSSTSGMQIAGTTAGATAAVLWDPFSGITPTANGKVYAMDNNVARGDVHITQIVDVV